MLPWGSAQVHEAEQPWTEPSETMSQSKSSLKLILSDIFDSDEKSNKCRSLSQMDTCHIAPSN
jgi:hypothetical protein